MEALVSQAAFRVLLDCLSRPGRIGNLEGTATATGVGICPFTARIALTLLDREVSFAVTGTDAVTWSRFIRLYTGARSAPLEQAGYLLADGGLPVPLDLLCRGSMEFPDRGATAVLRMEELASTSIGDATELALAGPGIPGRRSLWLRGLAPGNLAAFVQCNREYPLGIDLFLVDRQGQVVGLPRTVRVLDRGGA